MILECLAFWESRIRQDTRLSNFFCGNDSAWRALVDTQDSRMLCLSCVVFYSSFKKKGAPMKKVSVKRDVVFPVYESGGKDGNINPPFPYRGGKNVLLCEMFNELQSKGVRPGTKLRIIVETV